VGGVSARMVSQRKSMRTGDAIAAREQTGFKVLWIRLVR
jgi:hypothetical protein